MYISHKLELRGEKPILKALHVAFENNFYSFTMECKLKNDYPVCLFSFTESSDVIQKMFDAAVQVAKEEE